MTSEQLLIPRIEVKAAYPGCPFEEEEILYFRECVAIFNGIKKQVRPHLYTENIDQYGDYRRSIEAPVVARHPHLFRNLDWYERRDISDLPPYLKSLITPSKGDPFLHVMKVDRYEHRVGPPNKIHLWNKYGGFVAIDPRGLSFYLFDYEPASEEEYIEAVKGR